MSPKKECDIDSILKDIGSEMDDSQLMRKYDLSASGLSDVLRQLSNRGSIRLIDAKNLLHDLRMGMTNKSIMKKYCLSPNELKKVYEAVTKAGTDCFGSGARKCSKIKINAREFASDIRSGMTEKELMKIYNLSSRGLQSAFWKLVNSGVLTWDEILGIAPPRDAPVNSPKIRKWLRACPLPFIAVCEEGNPKNIGKVKDISENGIGILGVSAEIGDIKSLIVAPLGIIDLKPFRIGGICRWSSPNASGRTNNAGFEIIDLDRENLEKIEELLQFVTLTIARF